MITEKTASENSIALNCYTNLVDALRSDEPNRHDNKAGADAIERLERFRIGALRQLTAMQSRIKYGYSPGIGLGYFAYTAEGHQHYAGPHIEDAVMVLGGFEA